MWDNSDLFWIFWSILVIVASFVMLAIIEVRKSSKLSTATPTLMLALCAADGLFGLILAASRQPYEETAETVIFTTLVTAVPIFWAMSWTLTHDFGKMAAVQSKAKAPDNEPEEVQPRQDRVSEQITPSEDIPDQNSSTQGANLRAV